MNFTIYHIKPDWLRRAILVVLFPAVAVGNAAFAAVIEAACEIAGTWALAKDCWNAED